jgi:preprotein translocase subunit SecA
MRFHERMIMLSVLDGLWKDHLLNMDHLKEGIGLRGYGQQDPLVAYKRESFDMFEEMMARFQEDTVRYLFLMQIVGPDGQPIAIPARPREATLMGALAGAPELEAEPVQAQAPAAGPQGVESPEEKAPPRAWKPVASSTLDPRARQAAPVPIPVRSPATTIDRLEEDFQRRKKRELESARGNGNGSSEPESVQRRSGEKVGRNDLCPCGSGKKFKKCHGLGAA